MKLTKKRKSEIKKHLENISEMGRLELISFDMKMQEAKNQMDSLVWSWVNKGVVRQLKHLEDVDAACGGAIAVSSEIEEEDNI